MTNVAIDLKVFQRQHKKSNQSRIAPKRFYYQGYSSPTWNFTKENDSELN